MWTVSAVNTTSTNPSVLASSTKSKATAFASLTILVALYVVGAVSVPPGSLRHEIQTLPLWIPIVAGFKGVNLRSGQHCPC
jgi:hypothetical protein